MILDKKDYIKLGILLLLILLIIIILLFFNKKEENLKLFKQYDYVYSSSTNYSDNEFISELPQININSKSANEANKEILDNYYDIATMENSSYSYRYSVYNNILYMLIETNIYDDSQYGNINYKSYYVNIENGNVLSLDDVIKILGLTKNEIDNKISEKYREFYNNDSLRNGMTFEEYKKMLILDDVYTLSVEDNVVYVYKKINYTHDIEDSDNFGNIYQIKIKNLK